MQHLDERLDSAFGRISFTFNRFILDHMTRITRELDLDLESAYLWGVLANLNVMHLMSYDEPHPEYAIDDDRLAAELRGVRLSDLAQVTRIPRETVRRKLKMLESRGKVQRSADGRWAFTLAGLDEKAKTFTKETVLRYLKVAKEIEALLQEAKL